MASSSSAAATTGGSTNVESAVDGRTCKAPVFSAGGTPGELLSGIRAAHYRGR